MHIGIADIIAYVVSNLGALVAGGYLGYKFGDKVEGLVVKLLSVVKK